MRVLIGGYNRLDKILEKSKEYFKEDKVEFDCIIVTYAKENYMFEQETEYHSIVKVIKT